ncbi:MAG: hypothetical protein K2Y22_04145 [Candidatus Obscuribacterales bacterium]|nr:hypothetical protein [Candidatus Obscuribacterales bacterium]
MSYAQRFTVDLVTDASGAATGYTSIPVTGKISHIRYVKDGSTPFSDGVDFAITGEESGENIWTENDVNASKQVAPRQATHSNAGVASLYAAGGTAVQDKIAIANERVKIVIASGGNTKSGRFIVVVD